MSELFKSAELRHDFILLFDVTDGNPNGDPDNENIPRTDPETGQGIVTDVCLKRKIRDYVAETKKLQAPYRIYVQKSDVALIAKHEEAYNELGLKSTGTKQKREDVDRAREWMCQNYYDIRAFGAVMSVGVNCGQVRGPLQLTFARSIDPVFAHDISITRVAVTRKEDAAVVVGEDEKTKGKETEMGRKALLPYGLYRGYGFFNPLLAKRTGFKGDDLALFWEAVQQMFELDRSASRGFMAFRGLYVFTHDNATGRAPAHELFDLVRVERVVTDRPPRSFADYVVHKPEPGLVPKGVEFTPLVG